MFPFSYKRTFIYDVSAIKDFNIDLIENAFIRQLDIIKIKGNQIDFYNFNTFYKRHRWLNEGSMKFTLTEGKLIINLDLLIFLTPIIFVAISVYFIIANFRLKQMPGILAVLFCLWFFYFLLYMWTSATFIFTINNTVRRMIHEMNPVEQSFYHGQH